MRGSRGARPSPLTAFGVLIEKVDVVVREADTHLHTFVLLLGVLSGDRVDRIDRHQRSDVP